MTASLFTAHGRRWLIVMAVIGAVLTTVGVMLGHGLGWTSYLIASLYFLSLALGAALFLALMQVAGAGWQVAFKRVPEAIAAFLPIAALMLIVTLLGLPELYHWADPHAAHDPVLAAKHAYLNPQSFSLRMLAILAIWIAFVAVIRHHSRRQDSDGDVRHTRANVAVSAIFLIVVGWSSGIASVDWLMSLEPHWQSGIFGWTNLAGTLSAGVAAITVVVIRLRRRGFLPHVNAHHLGDLGKLTFAFSTLWAYLWLSQYLLIWYSNIPEETAYFLARTRGGWSFLFWLNVVVSWVVPFLMLMPRAAKRHEQHLLYANAIVLIGHWIDLYVMAMPSASPTHVGIGPFDVAAFVGVGAVFLIAVDRTLKGTTIVAAHDPCLSESVHHHT